MLKRLLSKTDSLETGSSAALPAGRRVYAIGDVHGRLDLLEVLAGEIDREIDAATNIDCSIVLLGDLVDRGPDSAGVVAFARTWQKRRPVRILLGNHEEMFLTSLEETEILRHFLRFGGRETLLSYGIEEDELVRSTLEEVQQLMRERIPDSEFAYIRGFEDMIDEGGYLFVHAGIDPEKPLDQQSPRELRWIRGPFLDHEGPLSHVVIHGHTIADEPEERSHRIGIDTGAFRSGRLTALVLEGTQRRYFATSPGQGGRVAVTARKAA